MSRQISPLPAPIGGLNAFNDYFSTPETDALTLVNFDCESLGIKLRKGFTTFASGIAGTPRSIFEYDSGAVQKIFAASGAVIYEISSGSAVARISGLLSDNWRFINFGTAGGRFLVGVNGFDTGRIYNGAAWSNMSVTGAASTELFSLFSFKERLFFLQKNSLSAWYLNVRSIGGALTEFPMSSFFRKGGKLAGAVTVSLNSNDGIADYVAFFTDRGEILIYSGVDPSSDFQLIGRYEIAPPIGDRFIAEYGGDALILTSEGVIAVSDIFSYGRVPPERNLSAKINPLLTDDYGVFSASQGWKILYAPMKQKLYVTVPQGGTRYKAYVMNTITRAWSLFEGVPFFAAEALSSGVYGAEGGSVALLENGFLDKGSPILAEMLTGYYPVGGYGNKFVHGVKPNISARGFEELEIFLDVQTDLGRRTLKNIINSGTPNEYAIWNVSRWNEAAWKPAARVFNQEKTVGKYGERFSINLRVRGSSSDFRWQGANFYYEMSQNV